MVPSTTREVLSLVQVTEVAGPPVEVQTRVCDDLSYMTFSTIGTPKNYITGYYNTIVTV